MTPNEIDKAFQRPFEFNESVNRNIGSLLELAKANTEAITEPQKTVDAYIRGIRNVGGKN